MSERKIAMMVFTSILTSNLLPSMTVSVDEYSNDGDYKLKKNKSNIIIVKADFTDRRNYKRYEKLIKIEEVIMLLKKTYRISIITSEDDMENSIYVGCGICNYNEIIFNYKDGETDKVIITDSEETPYNGYIDKCSLKSSSTNYKEDFQIVGVEKCIYVNMDFTIIKIGIEDIKVYDKEILEKEMIKLNQVVNISDRYLDKAIRNNLDILSNDITLGDMYKLKELHDFSGKISSLKDLEIAKNLEKLILNYSTIKDLTPLKNLKKLKEISIVNGLINAKPIDKDTDYSEVIESIIDVDGKVLFPKELAIEYNDFIEVIDIEKYKHNSENFIFRDMVKEGAKLIIARYKENNMNFQTQVIYKINNR